jgi:hypothetical protein
MSASDNSPGTSTLLPVRIPGVVILAATREVERFARGRVPASVRDQVRLEVLVRGNAITIVERRAPWHPDYGPEWSSLEIAQLRYDPEADIWSLHSRDSNGRWHRYSDAAVGQDVAPLIADVEADPTGIFWG